MATMTTPDRKEQRMAGRRQVREKLAAIELKQRRIDEIDVRIRGVDARIETHVAQHQATTAPLQSELTTVETRMRAALANREEIAAKDDAKHKELLRKIAEANSDLELAIAHEKTELVKLQRERQALESQTTDEQMLLNKLAQPALACPELYDRHFIAKRSVNWCSARVDAVRKELRKFEELQAADHAAWRRQQESRSAWVRHAGDEPPQPESEYDDLCRRLRLELETATELLAAAQAASDEIHRAMIDE